MTFDDTWRFNDWLRDWTIVSAANAGFASSQSKAVADTAESDRRILFIHSSWVEKRIILPIQKVYTLHLSIHTGLYCQSDM